MRVGGEKSDLIAWIESSEDSAAVPYSGLGWLGSLRFGREHLKHFLEWLNQMQWFVLNSYEQFKPSKQIGQTDRQTSYIC